MERRLRSVVPAEKSPADAARSEARAQLSRRIRARVPGDAAGDGAAARADRVDPSRGRPRGVRPPWRSRPHLRARRSSPSRRSRGEVATTRCGFDLGLDCARAPPLWDAGVSRGVGNRYLGIRRPPESAVPAPLLRTAFTSTSARSPPCTLRLPPPIHVVYWDQHGVKAPRQR